MAGPLTILALADLHYWRQTASARALPRVHTPFGPEWIRRCIDEARRLAPPDVIVLLGDIVDNGAVPGAEQDLAELAQVVAESQIPVVVVPGNHDRDPEMVFRVFGDRPGAHRIKGYNLYSFVDPFEPDERCTRPQDAIERFAAETSGERVIALQHNPLYPAVDCSQYPYMLLNANEVMASYERAGVTLSLSGHYHRGTELVTRNGVYYRACAGLGMSPYAYDLITVKDRQVECHTGALCLPDDVRRYDWHTHTHFGYCAENVHPAASEERARHVGLAGLGCVEHAGQLYVTRNEFWKKRHIEDPACMREARRNKTDRMAEFRAEMNGFRSDYLKVGLEVEVDREGAVTLLEEDRDGWDILLGGVHWLPDHLPSATHAQRVASLIKVTEQLVRSGIAILAHPVRCFYKQRLQRPTEAYRPIAQLLKAYDVAAEINWHTNDPDPEFFRICAETGVRITLGSDAHNLREVGALWPHIRLLRQIGLPWPDRTLVVGANGAVEKIPPD